MPRTLSLNFRKELFKQESGEVPIFLLTITHPSLTSPILLSTDATSRLTTDPLVYCTTSRGNNYLFAGVELELPDEIERAAPVARMSIANTSRDLIPFVRSITAPPPKIKIECVLLSALDTVETAWPALDMSEISYDVAAISFSMTLDALAEEPFPAGAFGPAYFPGLFY